MNRAPALGWGPGKNIDGSCLPEVARSRSRLCWEGLFAEDCWLDHYTPPPPVMDECHCLEILNYLCFFDALSPLEVGPDMGPWFMQPTPQADPGYRY